MKDYGDVVLSMGCHSRNYLFR